MYKDEMMMLGGAAAARMTDDGSNHIGLKVEEQEMMTMMIPHEPPKQQYYEEGDNNSTAMKWPQEEPFQQQQQNGPLKAAAAAQRQARTGIFELKKVFSSKMWQCRGCQFADKDKDLALQHLRTAHINPQKMKCKYCSVRCYSRKALADHTAQVHPGKRVPQPRPEDRKKSPQKTPAAQGLQCHKCKANFQTRNPWEDHMNSCIDEMKCSHCGQVFPKNPLGYIHLRQSVKDHEKMCPDKPVGRGAVDHPCPKCGMKFKYLKWMETHSKVCVQEIDCSLCGKTFQRGSQTLALLKKYVKDHEKNCATKTEAQRHKIKRCKYCHKNFNKGYNLNRHMLVCNKSKDGKVKDTTEEEEDDEDDGNEEDEDDFAD